MKKNKTIKILFPQIVVEQREVEVTEEQFDKLMNYSTDSEKADFIWAEMTDQEQQWTNGKSWLEAGIDVGYSGLLFGGC